MANIPEEQHPIERLADEIEFKQRNTTWPDVMVNASSSDEFMWKGSRRITKIQRVGVGLFGFLFLLSGVSIGSTVDGFWPAYLIAAGFLSVGSKLLWNSFRRNDNPKTLEKHE